LDENVATAALDVEKLMEENAIHKQALNNKQKTVFACIFDF
jgi:hypothetical protein